jgi:hypothetical protein
MTIDEPTPESDRLSVGETETTVTPAVPVSSIGRNRRVSIGSREFGLALVVSGAGGVVWVAGLVVGSGLIATAGGVLVALGLLTAVPLGVEMVREGADTGVEASAGPELGV